MKVLGKVIFVALFAISLGVNALLSMELDALLDADARRQTLLEEFRHARTPIEKAVALSGLGVDLNALRDCPTSAAGVPQWYSQYEDHQYRLKEQRAFLNELRLNQLR